MARQRSTALRPPRAARPGALASRRRDPGGRAQPQFGIGAAVGYRDAKISEVKAQAEGVTIMMPNADGSKMSTDYSGFFLRLGLRFAFMK